MEELWPTPSERACELIREVAEQLLPVSDELTELLWQASQRGSRQKEYVDDPVLSEADRRLNKTNMTHWLVANLNNPGRRVPPARDYEMMNLARDLVLRGMEADELESWRSASRASWHVWTRQCLAVTSDPELLRELLEVTANSMTAFIDDSIAAARTYVDEIRGELGLGAQEQRHTTVQLLLQGAQITRRRAEEQLGYALTGHHVAAITWVDDVGDVDKLERASEAVMRACGAPRRLTLVASSAAHWLWIPAQQVPETAAVLAALKPTPGVRVVFGRPAADLAGFRQSHLDAAAAQRLLARLGSPRQVVRYQDVHLADLLSSDLALAEQFVRATLGDLASADPDVQRAVRLYIDEGFNVSNTAARLFVHRNTIDRRLDKGRRLLPRPLDQDPTSVSAALMLLELRQDHAAGD